MLLIRIAAVVSIAYRRSLRQSSNRSGSFARRCTKGDLFDAASSWLVNSLAADGTPWCVNCTWCVRTQQLKALQTLTTEENNSAPHARISGTNNWGRHRAPCGSRHDQGRIGFVRSAFRSLNAFLRRKLNRSGMATIVSSSDADCRSSSCWCFSCHPGSDRSCSQNRRICSSLGSQPS